nr:MAG TPA: MITOCHONDRIAL PROCESSING PEPTIDASE ALPHA SUBUNIT zinc-binding motif, HYDROLASE [Caudoviricetes sp.]
MRTQTKKDETKRKAWFHPFCCLESRQEVKIQG